MDDGVEVRIANDLTEVKILTARSLAKALNDVLDDLAEDGVECVSVVGPWSDNVSGMIRLIERRVSLVLNFGAKTGH